MFQWLYGRSTGTKKLEEVYKKEQVLGEFYHDGVVQTPFGRSIAANDKNAYNYLIQSTTSDIVLSKARKVQKLLEGGDSFISMVVHDSIVIDMSEAEVHKIEPLIGAFGDTRYGNYKVNVRAGRTLKCEKEIQ